MLNARYWLARRSAQREGGMLVGDWGDILTSIQHPETSIAAGGRRLAIRVEQAITLKNWRNALTATGRFEAQLR